MAALGRAARSAGRRTDADATRTMPTALRASRCFELHQALRRLHGARRRVADGAARHRSRAARARTAPARARW
ncbi:MAG: hypothetical protein MZW92_60350 [Comamonadaceae bacterium]|nr:hypothetical protein [Comamonadaceae bacterium]